MSDDDRFERAVDLFNRRRYEESSELWEAFWADAPEDERPFVRALVQLSAALFLRLERGGLRGARNLLQQALVVFHRHQPERRGIDLEKLSLEVEGYIERLDPKTAGKPGRLDRWVAPKLSRRR